MAPFLTVVVFFAAGFLAVVAFLVEAEAGFFAGAFLAVVIVVGFLAAGAAGLVVPLGLAAALVVAAGFFAGVRLAGALGLTAGKVDFFATGLVFCLGERERQRDKMMRSLSTCLRRAR